MDVADDAPFGICALCRAPLGERDWNMDHIIPKALGGTDAPENLQRAHRTCNAIKGSYNAVVWCVLCHKSMHETRVPGHWIGLHRHANAHYPADPAIVAMVAAEATGPHAIAAHLRAKADPSAATRRQKRRHKARGPAQPEPRWGRNGTHRLHAGTPRVAPPTPSGVAVALP